MSDNKVQCIICGWRAACQKQFSMKAGQNCPDFVRDVTIKTEEDEQHKPHEDKQNP